MLSTSLKRTSAFVAVPLTILTAGLGAQEMPLDFAIENARLVTVSGGTIERGTIVVENGIISDVGESVSVPAGAWVVDGTGLTVYPGLTDGLSTLGMSREDAPPARSGPPGFGGGPPGGGGPNGSPPSLGPEDRPATFTWLMAADRLESDEGDFARWRSAGFTTVVTGPSRGFFAGNSAVVNLAGDRPNDMVVMTPVALRFNLSGGPDHRGYPSSLAGAFSYAKQLFSDATHYRTTRTLYDIDPRGRERPAYDRALEGVLPVESGERPLLFPGSSATEIRRALNTSADIGVPVIVYGVQHGYQMADELAGWGAPVLVSLDWPEAPRDGDPEADTPLSELRHRLLAPTTPARLQEAGVRFAFYADGNSGTEAIAAVRKAVEAGLSHGDAVRALTLSAAEIFGADDRIGSLEEGKIANLTVTDGDLFDEDTEVRMVFVDGRQFEADEEARRWADGPSGTRR